VAAVLDKEAMNAATEQQLILRWITPNPHKPGPADAWVLPGHVSVWAVIRQLELEGGDPASVTEVYELPVEAIEAARAYYLQHKRAVDARIQQNRAFFGA
jgi:uncharacterized protein (DUF433 family)